MHSWSTRILTAALVVLLLPAIAMRARADERYFVIVYGATHRPNIAQLSHTFATFIKATGTGEFPAGWTLEPYTISWLPCSLKVRLAAMPEPGRNFGLHETIRWAQTTADDIDLWGPYEVQIELYDRALLQISVLERGQVKYKAQDSGCRSSQASNCIHAVTTVASGYRVRIVTPAWGEAASYYVALRLYPWYINPCRTYPELLSALGLDCYHLRIDDLDTPPGGVSGVLVGLLERGRSGLR
jgi:hypothetical protein